MSAEESKPDSLEIVCGHCGWSFLRILATAIAVLTTTKIGTTMAAWSHTFQSMTLAARLISADELA